MENLKEILDYMGRFQRVEGEDGGMVIQALKDLVPSEVKFTEFRDLGRVKYYGVTEPQAPNQLDLLIFESDQYKFICIEETELDVSHGGTCYSGSVDLYLQSEGVSNG